MRVLSIKVLIRKKSGNLLNYSHTTAVFPQLDNPRRLVCYLTKKADKTSTKYRNLLTE